MNWTLFIQFGQIKNNKNKKTLNELSSLYQSKKKQRLTLSILQSRKAEKQRSTITQRLGNPDMLSPSSFVKTTSLRASSYLTDSCTESEMPKVLDLTSAHALQLVLLINPFLTRCSSRNGGPNSNRVPAATWL